MKDEFEAKKRQGIVGENVRFKAPYGLIELCETSEGKSAVNLVRESKAFPGKLGVTGDKINLKADVVKTWYNEPCHQTAKLIRDKLDEKENAEIRIIFLVGVFSEGKIFRESMKKYFSDECLIIPEEGAIVALRGAALGGFSPLKFEARVSRKTYGLRGYKDFHGTLHLSDNPKAQGKEGWCKDVFDKHIERGQQVLNSQPFPVKRYAVLDVNQSSLQFDVYSSTERDPAYVTDDGCTYLGQLNVDLHAGRDKTLLVCMVLTEDQLKVVATGEESGLRQEMSLDLLL